MTIFSRAATLAAMTLAMFALGGTSTASLAAETIATASIPTTVPVPAPTASVTTEPLVPVPGVATFASLAAAVAAHDVAGIAASDELHCLASAVYHEAKGEPLQGQLGVAEVVINRSESGRFGRTLCSVVTQKGQFSFVRGGHLPDVDQARAAYRTALAIARVAQADLWDSPAAQALYFNARHAPAAGLRRIATIGHHNFYR